MIEPGSPEWFARRCGKVTASRIADIMATTKTGPSASRQNYLAQLVAERLTGTVQESYTNGAMQWGTETEPLARARYEVKYGVMVDQIDFVDHPHIPMSGASPDGLIDSDGLIEIKCPNTATHINTLLTGKVENKYMLQMYWQMACTGRMWCDFVSFDPRLPEELSMFVTRVNQDADRLAEILKAVTVFLDDVESTIQKLKEIR